MTEEHYDILDRMVRNVRTFNKRQLMEALYWMVLGDGPIEHGKESRNCNISISHRSENEDYVIWKGAIMGRCFGYSISSQSISGGFGGNHEMIRLRSKAHPWINKVWDRLYAPIGRKALEPMALSLLGPIGLAILYQDDGSLSTTVRSKSGKQTSWIERNLLIHKLCFSKLELEALAKTIVDKFGIIFRVNRVRNKGLGYRLRLRSKDIDKFFDFIMPYVVPSMFYKVGRGGNQGIS